MSEKNSSTCCKISVAISVAAIVLSCVSFFCSNKSTPPEYGQSFNDKVKNLVLETIKSNPQLLMDAMGEGIAKKREDTIKQLELDIYNKKDEISNQSMRFGKLGSKNIVLCFFDPLCKHCIEFQKNMAKIIKLKTDVCFKLIPVAVVGEDSVILARAYLAAYEKNTDKALSFIEKIVSDKHSEAIDKTVIEKTLKSVGLNVKEIEANLQSMDKKLQENGKLAGSLKIPVVPAVFVVRGDSTTAKMIREAAEFEQLLATIEGKEIENSSNYKQ